MDVRRLCVVICAGGLVLGSAACGGASGTATATSGPRSPTAPAAAPSVTPTRAAATGTAPAITAGPATATLAAATSTPAPATATLPADRVFELAPIDEAEMLAASGTPPQYAVRVRSGLPSGCYEFADTTTSRADGEITITVRNSRPSDRKIACTQIYGTHEQVVELGGDFVSGTTYRVRVNDATLEFTAK